MLRIDVSSEWPPFLGFEPKSYLKYDFFFTDYQNDDAEHLDQQIIYDWGLIFRVFLWEYLELEAGSRKAEL